MAIDLKLVQWINANKISLSRAQVIDKLRKQGYDEQDIIDSYEWMVSQAGLEPPKDFVATILLSVVFPGAGHIYLGRIKTGIVLIALAIFGWLLSITIIGAVLGLPLLLVVTLISITGALKVQLSGYLI